MAGTSQTDSTTTVPQASAAKSSLLSFEEAQVMFLEYLRGLSQLRGCLRHRLPRRPPRL